MLKRNRGGTVNIGFGVATVIPSDPLYAVYAATIKRILISSPGVSMWITRTRGLMSNVRFHYMWQQRWLQLEDLPSQFHPTMAMLRVVSGTWATSLSALHIGRQVFLGIRKKGQLKGF